MDEGSPAWHYILVPANKLAEFKAQKNGGRMNVLQFGRMIYYYDCEGKSKKASGWGKDPPKMLERWINNHYGPPSVDENISLVYEKDDIRLCTMQRAIPKQILGVYLQLNEIKDRFHYLTLIENSQSTLAIRSGLKNYDRIILLNGINVENDTVAQFDNRFKSQQHLPVQILVCSPATYIHYKTNKKIIHCDLPAVQHLTPVYATSTSDSDTDTPVISFDANSFCAVQWDNTNLVSTVRQSAILKAPEFTHVNDICFAEKKGKYLRGQIIFKGSYNDCQKFSTSSISSIPAKVFNKLANVFVKRPRNFFSSTANSNSDVIGSETMPFLDTPNTVSSETSSQDLPINAMQVQIAMQHTNNDIRQDIEECLSTTLEQLPNELFFSLFTYLDTPDLYNAFYELNSRLNSLFQYYGNLSLTFDDQTDQLLMKAYAPYITRLILDTSVSCDLSQFTSLQTLIVCDGNAKHLEQIQANIIPNPTHLSFLLGSQFTPPVQLVKNIFSNEFPSLCHVNLSRIDNVNTYVWSTSSSLRFVAIRSNQPLIVSRILASCPNLHHLQLHVLYKDHQNTIWSPPSNHPLRRLTLWSNNVELTLNDVDTLLTYTANVEYFYFQTKCRIPFIDLVDCVINRLTCLSQFDCYIKEMIDRIHRNDNLASVHQLHSCFNRIQYLEEQIDYRIFGTE